MLMRRIYQRSRRTIVYLGEEREHCKDLPRLIGLINQDIRLPEGHTVLSAFTPEYDAVFGQIPDMKDVWKAWYTVLSQPWFRRVWVIQELACAPHLQFQCGRFALCSPESGQISFEDFAIANWRANFLMVPETSGDRALYHAMRKGALALSMM